MAQEWDIKPRASTCTRCEKAFDDGERCYSALVLDEASYRREDLCDVCRQENEPEQSILVSTWQGIFIKPPPPPEEPLKKENAESLLRRLMEDDEANGNVIYILAVMLERKKVLIEKAVKSNEDGTSLRVYEHRVTGETFLIPDPHLQLDQLETVQQEVVERLGGAPRPGMGEAPAAEPEAEAVAEPEADAGPESGPEHHV